MLQALLRLVYVAGADVVLFAAGVPLQRYALNVAVHDAHDTRLILLLLVANLALLGLIATAALAGVDGVRRFFACRNSAGFRARPR